MATADERSMIAFYSKYKPYNNSPLAGYWQIKSNSTSGANRFNYGYTVWQPESETDMRNATRAIVQEADTNPFMTFNETMAAANSFTTFEDYAVEKQVCSLTRSYMLPDVPELSQTSGTVGCENKGNVAVCPCFSDTSGYRRDLARYTFEGGHVQSDIRLPPNDNVFVSYVSMVTDQNYIILTDTSNERQIVVYRQSDFTSPLATFTIQSTSTADPWYVYARERESDGRVVIACVFANENEVAYTTWIPGTTTTGPWTSYNFDRDARYIGLLKHTAFIIGLKNDGDQTDTDLTVLNTSDGTTAILATFDGTLAYPGFNGYRLASSTPRVVSVGAFRPTTSDPLVPTLFGITTAGIYIIDDTLPTDTSTFDFCVDVSSDGTSVVVGVAGASPDYIGSVRVYLGVSGTTTLPPTYIYNNSSLGGWGIRIRSIHWITHDTTGVITPYVHVAAQKQNIVFFVLPSDLRRPLSAVTLPPQSSTNNAYLFDDGSVRVLTPTGGLVESSAGDGTLQISNTDESRRRLMNMQTPSLLADQMWASPNGRYIARYVRSTDVWELRYWTTANDWTTTYWAGVLAQDQTRYNSLIAAQKTVCDEMLAVNTAAFGPDQEWPWKGCACLNNNSAILDAVFTNPDDQQIYLSTAPCLWGPCDDSVGVGTGNVVTVTQQVLASMNCDGEPRQLCTDDVKEPEPSDLSTEVDVSIAYCGVGPTCDGKSCRDKTCYLGKLCLPTCTTDEDCTDNVLDECVENACLIPCSSLNTACPNGLECDTSLRACVQNGGGGGDDDGGLGTAAWAGIAIGILLVVGGIIAGIVVAAKKTPEMDESKNI